MSKSEPVVVHPEESIAGPTPPGMELRHPIDPAGRWVGPSGWIRVVPSPTIHRKVTGPDADLEAFGLRVGGEPEKVNVDRPEGAGR